MVCNAVVATSAIVSGLYFKHLTDLTHRHTFLDARSLIARDMRNQKERDKQVIGEVKVISLPRDDVMTLKRNSFYWSLWRESTSYQWIPLTKGQ